MWAFDHSGLPEPLLVGHGGSQTASSIHCRARHQPTPQQCINVSLNITHPWAIFLLKEQMSAYLFQPPNKEEYCNNTDHCDNCKHGYDCRLNFRRHDSALTIQKEREKEVEERKRRNEKGGTRGKNTDESTVKHTH